MTRAGWRVINGIAATLLGVLAASGCSVLPPPATEATKSIITKMPASVPQRAANGATLLVFPPETAALYATTQMAYATQAYQIEYFSQHEWGETPSQMLLPLLVKTLENTHAFGAVLTPPYAGRYSYALRTGIAQLMQDFTTTPPVLVLSLRLQLSDGSTNRIIAAKTISLREPMRQKAPDAGVEAANNAAAKALEETARFVLENTE